jgi:hypothetical protein
MFRNEDGGCPPHGFFLFFLVGFYRSSFKNVAARKEENIKFMILCDIFKLILILFSDKSAACQLIGVQQCLLL